VTLRRLVLVRHGQTDYNADGRMQGHIDSELTDLGIAQARGAAPFLAGYLPVRLLSSDLSRAARTAAELGLVTGLPVMLDSRLRETYLGKWQGYTPGEVEANWPGALATWRGDPTWAPPGGESKVDVAARALPVVEELDARYTGDEPVTVMFCAHGGVIAALSCALIGLDPPSWNALGGLGNVHWVVLRRRTESGGRWRLTGFDIGVLDRPSSAGV
jgi:2,3-bisphosphoglycerate-dependent phosphoglycerate mutase/probable phosphoglycerate mutase